jgi:hypothetical protein
MFEVIEKMEIQINENQHRHLADKEVIHRLEEKLRREEEKRVQAETKLEEINYNIYSAGEETENYKK